MTLTELRYAVALAETRHFGRAASACFISQPTLSIAVKRLEATLAVTLFVRGSSEVTLTENHRVTLVPRLREPGESVIHTGVAVRVVLTEHLADDLGALTCRP